jgi:hypothetical protein
MNLTLADDPELRAMLEPSIRKMEADLAEQTRASMPESGCVRSTCSNARF